MVTLDRASDEYAAEFCTTATKILAALVWQFGEGSSVVLAAQEILDGLEPQVAFYSQGNGDIFREIYIDDFDLTWINLLLVSHLGISVESRGLDRYSFEVLNLGESYE